MSPYPPDSFSPRGLGRATIPGTGVGVRLSQNSGGRCSVRRGMRKRDEVWGFWSGVFEEPAQRSELARVESALAVWPEPELPRRQAWGPSALAHQIETGFWQSLSHILGAAMVASGVISGNLVTPVQSRIWVLSDTRRA